MPTATPAPEHIAEAAYFLWLEEGCPEGREAEHWHRAAAALSAPAPRKRAAPKKAAAAKPAANPRARKSATTDS